MECVKGDPVIYVAAVKMLKLPERKKNAWKETSSALGIHIAQNQLYVKEVYETSKKRKELPV